MSIYRTNNPTEFDEVDGIIIDESAPPSQVKGVGTGIAILVGVAQIIYTCTSIYIKWKYRDKYKGD